MSRVPILFQIRRKIDRARAVSFDIFDTLLLRPYLRPTDLFYHLELLEDMPGFCNERIDAERRARNRHWPKEEITFDEIYEEIMPMFRHVKEKELALEFQVLTQNPEMYEVYQYALRTGKQIIIASDMYLPHEFIAAALHKNGYEKYDLFYVSCSDRQTKCSSSMYRRILDETGLAPEGILHIGDNKHADFRNAKKMGIRAVLYKNVAAQYLESSRSAKLFKWQYGWDFGASIIISVMAMRWQKVRMGILPDNYWTEFGYKYGGPVAYGFTAWVAKIAAKKGIDSILFVARDGYTIQKVFDLLNTGITSQYVYAPRFLNQVCRLDFEGNSKQKARDTVDYFAKIDCRVRELAGGRGFDAVCFIDENKNEFNRVATNLHANYKNYLARVIGGARNIGLVDSTTGMFTSQKLVQNSLPPHVENLHGFYWWFHELAADKKHSYSCDAFSDTAPFADWSDIQSYRWNLMEFLFSSPEYPIKNLDDNGSPEYDDTSRHEKTRSDIYEMVSGGAVEFARDMKRIFGEWAPEFGIVALTRNVKSVQDAPSRADKKHLSRLYWADDSGHKRYAPIMGARLPLFTVIRHPFKTLRMVKKFYWRTLMQSVVLCIISPINFHFRGFKRIEIFLLPKLMRRYFTAALDISFDNYYRISIGRRY